MGNVDYPFIASIPGPFLPGVVAPDRTKLYTYALFKIELGLVSLFNGISTFVGYLMPKIFSEKNISGTI